MSNDIQQTNDSGEDVTEFDLTNDPANEGRTSSWVKWLTILCFIGVIALAAAIYYLVVLGQQELDVFKQELQSNIEAEVQTQADSGLEAIDELQTRLASTLTAQEQFKSSMEAAINDLKDSQTAVQASLSALNQERPESNLDWSLSEIENLLIIAIQQLQLANDTQTAIAALESADLRLQDLSDPSLLSLRQQLTNDLNNLKAVNQVDIAGMSLYLSDLVAKVDSLPIKENIVETSIDAEGHQVKSLEDMSWQDKLWSLPGLIWQEIKANLVIKRNDEIDGTRAFLLPQQEYYLYQNLSLQLQSAKLAVLSKDTANLQASVDMILTWLEKYFKTGDAAVSNVIEALSKMQGVELNPDIPDISSSLETLRAVVRNNQADNK